MAGCMEGFRRANSKNRMGDMEGSITELKRGRMPLSLENGKVVLWIVRGDDIVLRPEDVKSVSLISSNVLVKNLASSGGKNSIVNIYNVQFNNGKSGTMRLYVGSASKVLSIWGK